MVKTDAARQSLVPETPRENWSDRFKEVMRRPEGERARVFKSWMRARGRIVARKAALDDAQEPYDKDITDFVAARDNEHLLETMFGLKPSDNGRGFTVYAQEGEVPLGKVTTSTGLDVKGEEVEDRLKKMAKRLSRKFHKPLKDFRRYHAPTIISLLWDERSESLRQRWQKKGFLAEKVKTQITSPRPKEKKPAAVPAAQAQTSAAPAVASAPAAVTPAEPASAPTEQPTPAAATVPSVVTEQNQSH